MSDNDDFEYVLSVSYDGIYNQYNVTLGKYNSDGDLIRSMVTSPKELFELREKYSEEVSE